MEAHDMWTFDKNPLFVLAPREFSSSLFTYRKEGHYNYKYQVFHAVLSITIQWFLVSWVGSAAMRNFVMIWMHGVILEWHHSFKVGPSEMCSCHWTIVLSRMMIVMSMHAKQRYLPGDGRYILAAAALDPAHRFAHDFGHR